MEAGTIRMISLQISNFKPCLIIIAYVQNERELMF